MTWRCVGLTAPEFGVFMSFSGILKSRKGPLLKNIIITGILVPSPAVQIEAVEQNGTKRKKKTKCKNS